MKSQHIEHAIVETVGGYNKDAGEHVTICMPQSQRPQALIRIPLSDIPSDLREVVKNDGIRLLATIDVEDTGVEHEETYILSNVRLAQES